MTQIKKGYKRLNHDLHDLHDKTDIKSRNQKNHGADKMKQTEIGIIPEDWEVKRLGEIGIFSKGSGISKSEVISGNIPAIRYGELYTKHNDYIKDFFSWISFEVASKAKKLKKGDLLFAGSGETKEEIGKCVAYTKDAEAFAGGDIIIFSPHHNNDSVFLGFLLNTSSIQKQKSQKGQGDAIVHISANSLSTVQLPIPQNKAEQTSIATVLSDMDKCVCWKMLKIENC